MSDSEQEQDGQGRRFRGPLFVVGMPRSGTKLLREILNRHSDVYIPDVETEFLPYMYTRWLRFGDVSKREAFNRMCRVMERFSYFQYRKVKGATIDAKAWYDACESFDLAGVFEALVRLDTGMGFRADAIWGDKSPSYIRHLGLLRTIFPGARIVHIVRDVRDYCRSIERAWGKNPVRAAFRWNNALLDVAHRKRHDPAGYLEVRYERLLGEPETEIRRLCGFVGIRYEKDMLEIGEGTENLGDAKDARAIVHSNKGKFVTAFDNKTLRQIEEAALPAMEAHDYKPLLATRYLPPSTFRLYLYQIMDGWNLAKGDHPGRGRLGGALFHLAYKRITRIRS